MNKKRITLYKVTYHEVGTTDYRVIFMDSDGLFSLVRDWAFKIDKVESL